MGSRSNQRLGLSRSEKVVKQAEKDFDTATDEAHRVYMKAVVPAERAFNEAVTPFEVALQEARLAANKTFNEATALPDQAYNKAMADARAAYEQVLKEEGLERNPLRSAHESASVEAAEENAGPSYLQRSIVNLGGEK